MTLGEIFDPLGGSHFPFAKRKDGFYDFKIS